MLQLERYLDLLNRDPVLTGKGPVRGVFARALVEYDALRGHPQRR